MEFAPELIGSVVGVALSLFASYVPGFRDEWAGLEPDKKRAYMGAFVVSFGVGIYVLACTATAFFVACPSGGAWRLVSIIISALISNQAVYPITPQVVKPR